jgi:hypothetical protein
MSNRQIVERALQRFADPARRQEYFELYSEDIVLHGYQGVGPGLSEVKRFYDSFWDVFPDAQVNPQEIVDQGDVLVIRYVRYPNEGSSYRESAINAITGSAIPFFSHQTRTAE